MLSKTVRYALLDIVLLLVKHVKFVLLEHSMMVLLQELVLHVLSMERRLFIMGLQLSLPVLIVARVSILMHKWSVKIVLKAEYHLVMETLFVLRVVMETRLPDQEALLVYTVQLENMEQQMVHVQLVHQGEAMTAAV